MKQFENDQFKTNSVYQPTGYEGLYYYPDGNLPWRDAERPVVITGGTPPQFGYDFELRPAFEVTGSVQAPGISDYSSVDFDVYDAVTGKKLEPKLVLQGRTKEIGEMANFKVWSYMDEKAGGGKTVRVKWVDILRDGVMVRSRLVAMASPATSGSSGARRAWVTRSPT